MAGTITQLLLETQSHDHNIRTGAENQLNAYRDQNFAQYILALSTELANAAKPADARQVAGLVLKNLLDAKEEARKLDHYNRWMGSDPAVKAQVRRQLLDTLTDEQLAAAKTAALVIAKVASIDLPANQWPELISALLNNMTQLANAGLRQCTLEALGYVCEEMAQKPEDVLTPEQVRLAQPTYARPPCCCAFAMRAAPPALP
jgi:importin subunit beta-1